MFVVQGRVQVGTVGRQLHLLPREAFQKAHPSHDHTMLMAARGVYHYTRLVGPGLRDISCCLPSRTCQQFRLLQRRPQSLKLIDFSLSLAY